MGCVPHITFQALTFHCMWLFTNYFLTFLLYFFSTSHSWFSSLTFVSILPLRLLFLHLILKCEQYFVSWFGSWCCSCLLLCILPGQYHFHGLTCLWSPNFMDGLTYIHSFNGHTYIYDLHVSTCNLDFFWTVLAYWIFHWHFP